MSQSNGAAVGDAATVLIIGAGLTGLAIAQGLKKAGIKYLIFEREPVNLQRARDWNIGLHWGAPILKTLIPPELYTQLDSCQVDPSKPCPPEDTIRFLNAKLGEQIGSSTLPHFYRIIRSKLRALISTGIPILYSKTLSTLNYSADGKAVTVLFDDGTSYTGCLVIGADGHHSAVRNHLVGPENAALTTLPFAASIVQATYTPEQVTFLRSFHPLYIAGIHPLGLMGWVGLHSAQDQSHPETWIMNHYISFATTPAEVEATKHWDSTMRLRQLQEMAEMFSEPWKSAFAWLKDDQKVWYAPLTQWDPSLPEHAWDNHGGRVTLAGDAAHPMTFQRGQGLNSAFKDALELVNHIASFLSPATEPLADALTDEAATMPSLPSASVIINTSASGVTPVGALEGQAKISREEAIDAYEKEMIARTGLEVRLSAENTRMVHNWEEVLESPLIKKGFKKAD